MDDILFVPNYESPIFQELEFKADKYYEAKELINEQVNDTVRQSMRLLLLIIPTFIFLVIVFSANSTIVTLISLVCLLTMFSASSSSAAEKLKIKFRALVERFIYTEEIKKLETSKKEMYIFISENSEIFEWVAIDPELYEYYSFGNFVVDYYKTKI